MSLNTRRGRAACTLLVAVVATALPRVALAGDAAAAREQLIQGYNLSQQGKCKEAIPFFKESVRLEAKAITLINLAKCEEAEGKTADALGHWVDARAKAVAEGSTAIEEEATKRAKALEPKLPKLTVRLAKGVPANVEVRRDDVVLGAVSLGRPLPVNPGDHVITVRSPDHEEWSTKVTTIELDTVEVEVQVGKLRPKNVGPEPGAPGAPPPPAPTSPLVYAGFGVGAAGLAVGAITGLMALGKASATRTNCPDQRCATQDGLDDARTGQTLGTVSTVGFIVAGVGAAVGVYGLVWGGKKQNGAAAPAVYVGASPGGAMLKGTF
jgi:hypothetical protein